MVKYASYVDCLRVAVKTEGVTAEDLRSFLLSLPALLSPTSSKTSEGQQLTLLSDKKNELQRCDSVTAIFDLLNTTCASFLSYDIFQYILKRYKINAEQEELNYPNHIKAYIEKHTISVFTKVNPLLKSKKGSKELTLKVDIKTTCRLTRVVKIKKLIAEIMDLNPSALELVDIKDGCVVVTFLIPASVADAIFTPDTVFTSQQEDKLRAASVLWLKCNEYTFDLEVKTKSDNQGNYNNYNTMCNGNQYCKLSTVH